VTKEKEIEHELRESEERYRELFENAFDLIQSVDDQAIFHNITDRKMNERVLQKAHELLEHRVRERTLELTRTNRLLTEKIGEQKKAERELTQAYEQLKTTQTQLVQSAKLASIGELASGVAHELNQPLMVIRANAQMVKKEMAKNGRNGLDRDRYPTLQSQE